MPKQKDWNITRMSLQEISLAIDWAAKERWMVGPYDAACFHQIDPQGFFVGKLAGKPIAVAAALIYDDHFAFYGLYIVKPKYRNSGYGLQLTQECLRYIGNRITGLDGVLNMTDKYARLGYVYCYKNTRYISEKLLTFPHILGDTALQPLNKIPFDQLVTFDRRFFPASRTNFLRCWIQQPESAALGYVENKQLKGYGVIKKCIKGFKIGPLFADTPLIAEKLFQALCQKIQKPPIYIDIPEPNHNALTLVNKYQLVPQFATARMYRNGTPKIDVEGIYSITTFEAG